MKKLRFIFFLSMIYCWTFSRTTYANSDAEHLLYSLQTTASRELPYSRIRNYSIGDNGNIAVAFRGKEIIIYNSNGQFLNHIIVKDSEHFFIDYREGSNNIDIFFARNDTAILISEKGEVLEEYKYTEDEIKDRRLSSGKYTKVTEDFTYKMKSSFNFPITTHCTKIIQTNNVTGKEKVILDNPLMSIIESVGLVFLILVYCGLFFMILFKFIKFCVRCVVSKVRK